MIAHLQGTVAEASPTHVIIDCHGVGYSVFIPVSSYDKLPVVGGAVKLLTYHHVIAQDGAHQLYGFATPEEREMFLLLISISGIGPKLACNILSSSSIPALRSAIATADVKALSSLRGIGKKTAERLVLELKDKVGVPAEVPGHAKPTTPADQRLTDAVLALIALGYKQAEASKAVQTAAGSVASDAPLEELVRAALRTT
jgi:Holliday junction DNA helicase RuvA